MPTAMLDRCEARHDTATLSSTVRPAIRCTAWKVRLTPRWKRCCGSRPVTSVPPSSTRPADGLTVPPITPSSVDFPAPFGPHIPYRPRAGSARLTASSTCSPP